MAEVAQTIKTLRERLVRMQHPGLPDVLLGITLASHALSRQLEKTHSRFDRGAFLLACGAAP